MRNAGLFFFLSASLVSAFIASAGCSSSNGGSGNASTTTTTHPSGSSSSGNTTGTGGKAGTGGGASTGGSGTGGQASGDHCNPVTNDKCTSPQYCDYTLDSQDMTVGFECYDSEVNTVCGDCTADGYCGPGTTCFTTDSSNGVCAKYCCTDADCSGSGMCDKGDPSQPYFGPDAPQLGICVLKNPPDGGATGPYDCNPPSPSPSNGSCITVKP